MARCDRFSISIASWQVLLLGEVWGQLEGAPRGKEGVDGIGPEG